jgi:hypothetical protein
MQSTGESRHARCWRVWGAPLALLCLLGCAGSSSDSDKGALSQSQALQLAVELANEECQAQFAAAPFDTASYSIRFVNDRWWWGGLDLAGPGGLSASVSFDAAGGDRRVEAYLSTDQLQGQIGPDSARVPER